MELDEPHHPPAGRAGGRGNPRRGRVRLLPAQPRAVRALYMRTAREDGLFSPSSTTTGINGDDMWLCDLKARYK